MAAGNGRLRVMLAPRGMTVAPAGSPAPLGYRLAEIRRGDQVLYTAQDTPPQAQDRRDRAAYDRGGIAEVYWMQDMQLEQLFLLPRAVDGMGDLLLTGLHVLP